MKRRENLTVLTATFLTTGNFLLSSTHAFSETPDGLFSLDFLVHGATHSPPPPGKAPLVNSHQPYSLQASLCPLP